MVRPRVSRVPRSSRATLLALVFRYVFLSTSFMALFAFNSCPDLQPSNVSSSTNFFRSHPSSLSSDVYGITPIHHNASTEPPTFPNNTISPTYQQHNLVALSCRLHAISLVPKNNAPRLRHSFGLIWTRCSVHPSLALAPHALSDGVSNP